MAEKHVLRNAKLQIGDRVRSEGCTAESPTQWHGTIVQIEGIVNGRLTYIVSWDTYLNKYARKEDEKIAKVDPFKVRANEPVKIED